MSLELGSREEQPQPTLGVGGGVRGAPESRAEARKSRPGVGLRRQDWPRTAEAPGREGGVWRAAEVPCRQSLQNWGWGCPHRVQFRLGESWERVETGLPVGFGGKPGAGRPSGAGAGAAGGALTAPCCSSDGDPPAAGRAPGPVRLLAGRPLRTLSQTASSPINTWPGMPVSCLPALATRAHHRRLRESPVGTLSGPRFLQLFREG